ncbi:MAG: ABC transporter permease [Lachnospiraceae bacterium]|nr:ABC transporter permease [Lachnospiraceae bacterium]
MSNKKIVFQVTKEYMKKNKKRTMTTLFGIIFMVMLMTCVFVGKDTAVNYLEILASQSQGKWHINAYEVDASQYEKIKDLDAVDETAVSVGYDLSVFEQSANPVRPYINLKAYSKENFDWMNMTLVEGRYPENSEEIVLCVDAKNDGADIKIGDEISVDCFKRFLSKSENSKTNTIFPYYNLVLQPGDYVEAPDNFFYFAPEDTDPVEEFVEEREYTGFKATYKVVGFVGRPIYEADSSAAYTAITLQDDNTTIDGTFNVSIRFNLSKLDGEYNGIEEIVGGYDNIEFNGILLAFSGNSPDSTISGMVDIMTVFFVVIIIAASVILIYNVFNMSFEERSKYLGMLSSVGATGKQKRSSVYYEAFTLLLVSLPVGFLVGLGVVKLGMTILKPYMDTLLGIYSNVGFDKVPLKISLIGVLFTVVFSVFTVWISAYLPARKIGKIGPIECIRGNASRSKKTHKVNKLAIKLFKAEGLLAANSVKRKKKKTRGIIGAVAVFIMILIITAFSSNLLTTMISHVLIDDANISVNYENDFVIQNYVGDDYEEQMQELIGKARNDENVEDVVEYIYDFNMAFVDENIIGQEYNQAREKIFDAYGVSEEDRERMRNPHPLKYKEVSVMAFDDAHFDQIAKACGVDKTILNDDTKTPVILVGFAEVSTDNMVYGDTADYKFYEIENAFAKNVGDEFPLHVYDSDTKEYKDINVTVAAVADRESLEDYVTLHSEQVWIITKLDTMEEMRQIKCTDEYSGMVFRDVMVKFSNQDCELYKELGELALAVKNDGEGILVYGKEMLDTKTLETALNSVIRILLICFVALTSIICLLNLYNSTKGRISTQKKEFAVLRSMGMTDKQMIKMLALESGQILIRAVAVAVLVATPVIIFIKNTLMDMYGFVKIEVPWMIYIVAILVATVALFAVTFVSFKTEKNENIIEDIRRESV